MSIEPGAVLPGAIAEQLRTSIIAQAEPPGSTVTESAVALRFGVARPTARLAIDRLVADGLLRREAHQAARVPELGRADIIDLYDNRAVVESAAVAALASAGVVPAAAVEAHRSLLASDDFAHHDIAFHRSLVAGQPSPRLAHLHGLLMGEIELCIGQVQAAHLLTAAEVGTQHQGILDSIIAGDPDAAARLTRQHIEGARDALLAHVDNKHRARES
ncbi:MAG: GntR family transcriptional regulator [Rhodoglobus sp.]|nr:GntR family transcriptional regulator [Rhodoglobus sp.]